MVYVVPLSSGPSGEEVVQAPWELVSAVGIDGLEEPENDPCVHGQDVQVAGDGAPENWRADGWDTEKHNLDRGGVLSGEAERRRVLVVNFVDIFVERTPVEGAVQPVVSGVFHYEEDGNLQRHCEEGGERNTGPHAEVVGHRVKKPANVSTAD